MARRATRQLPLEAFLATGEDAIRWRPRGARMTRGGRSVQQARNEHSVLQTRDERSVLRTQDERSVLEAYAEYNDVDQNVYVSRPRNQLDVEDIHYCSCEAEVGEGAVCGETCENRACQTECVQGLCSTGGKCGNQRFQEGARAALGLRSTNRKGISLFADQNIACGEFVVQYVGEVLDKEAYFERERWELMFTDRTYGLQVDDRDVIDARYIGGIARFANHSCYPNCVVQRWEVAGETCCGLFADCDIARGDEITFHYGNATKRRALPCFCGAEDCVGSL